MSFIETENVVLFRNIVREIIRECLSKGFSITDSCASFVVKLLVLNPKHGFAPGQKMQREDVQRLVWLCVDKLTEKNSPSLATIKMQVFFDTNYASRDEIASKNRENLKSETSPLVTEILESVATTKGEMEKLYQKIVIMIIDLSGLGDSNNIKVIKETTAALQSVFPTSELREFMTLLSEEKEQQLSELTEIVAGIRLFNKDCQKGGEDIEDLPNFLRQASGTARSSLQSGLMKLLENVNILTTAVDIGWRILVFSVKEDDEIKLEESSQVTWANVELARDMLVTARQEEIYLRKLLSELELCEESIQKLLTWLQDRLLRIHDTVRFRTAIPTTQVYPQFIELANIWALMQDEMAIMSNISNILWNLHSYAQVLDYIDGSVLKAMLGDNKILSDADRLEATMTHLIEIEKIENCTFVSPARTDDFDNLPLQYLGFCAWAIVEGRGVLIPANQNMGVLKWKEKYYAFSSTTAACSFDEDPERYVAWVLSFVCTHPEYISLLQLHDDVSAVLEVKDQPPAVVPAVTKQDYGMQTELHPVPSYIDPDYTWNEWELRRKAVQLANISKCATKNTQTKISSMRSSIGILAKPPKDVSTQTKRDNWTTMPKQQHYIWGLRGRRGIAPHVISLTFPEHK